MDLKTFTARAARTVRATVAGVSLALVGSVAGAVTLDDVTVGTTSIFDADLDTSVLGLGGETLVSTGNFFDVFFEIFIEDASGDVGTDSDTDLLILPPAGDLSGKAEDWAVDTALDTFSILYSVTGGSLTTAPFVVAVLDFSGGLFPLDLFDPFDLSQMDLGAPSVSVFEASPIPLPAGLPLLLGGIAILGFVRKRAG